MPKKRKSSAIHHPRSLCPITCTLDIIGDKWTLVVVRDLMLGRSLYRDFQSSPEGIATNILADRLSRLVDAGLAETYPSPQKSGTHAYRLTEKGKTLKPVVGAIVEWGLEHIEGTEVRLQANDM